jgi:hypothetical protein
MARRRNSVRLKSSDFIIFIFFIGIFFLYCILYLIASFLDYLIDLSKEWTYLQWGGYSIAFFIGLVYDLYQYKLIKKETLYINKH